MNTLIPNGKELSFAPYIITEDGRVYSKYRNRILKPADNGIGYLQCYLKSNDNTSRWFKVHRLVALMYIPNPDNLPEVNHLDGNKANNHYSNLAWVTHKENINHAITILGKKLGLAGRTGKDHPLYGTRRSDETRLLMRTKKIGVNHPKFKGYYEYEGIRYDSRSSIAAFLKTSPYSIKNLIDKGFVKFIPKQCSVNE